MNRVEDNIRNYTKNGMTKRAVPSYLSDEALQELIAASSLLLKRYRNPCCSSHSASETGPFESSSSCHSCIVPALPPSSGRIFSGTIKMRLSAAAVAGVMLTGYTGIGIVAFLPFVIWVYSFFHANNLGALSDEEFYRVEDKHYRCALRYFPQLPPVQSVLPVLHFRYFPQDLRPQDFLHHPVYPIIEVVQLPVVLS
mgnify:CR=1 FL=1